MSSRFKRPLHNQVLAHLRLLDSSFLDQCSCFFGGGSRIAMELGEYRESKDIDFLCADRDGYRALRETIAEDTLGSVAKGRIALAREVRADNYGIRTRLGPAETALKFEIVREARIALTGVRVPGLPVTCLGRVSSFAEKLLANADRGPDRATLSRDVIDLAFMIEGWDGDDAIDGYAQAMGAYGRDIERKLGRVLELMRERAYRARCIDGLAIHDTKTLAKGLKRLASLKPPPSRGPPGPRSTPAGSPAPRGG